MITIMNDTPEDIKRCIFSNLVHNESILSLRSTCSTHNNIVKSILREEYEQELCILFKNLRISRKNPNGSCRMKDLIRKAFPCYASPKLRVQCYHCGKLHDGILSCNCPKRPLRQAFFGPLIAAITIVCILSFKTTFKNIIKII